MVNPKTLIQGPKLLLLASGMLLAIAGLNFWRFGGSAYYASTGHPLGWPTLFHHPAKVQVLPQFQVAESIGQTTLSPGDTQSIVVSTKPNATANAILEVWVTALPNKEVWKSPAVDPTKYSIGSPVTHTYSYTLPQTAKPGTYTASVIITSPSTHTDYFVKENFAEFKVL